MSSPAHGPCLSGLGELWRGNIIYRVPQNVSQRSEMQSEALNPIENLTICFPTAGYFDRWYETAISKSLSRLQVYNLEKFKNETNVTPKIGPPEPI